MVNGVDPASRLSSASAGFSDAKFARVWDWYYLQSVRAAAEETFREAVGRSQYEVLDVLTRALQRRGIEPEVEAVMAGAALISRGRKPLILHPEALKPGEGSRRS